ncbi:hypothetical protein KQX54_020730 [Cotesia glomerata]|uniref:Uncharacterized protein n=1 Tax=Cotesia glomerata TaxID=32391 RepID=A0AAV7I2M4_COTGL|nr:hypothetical protein KQX54_020730 [Cotesia glomerata]
MKVAGFPPCKYLSQIPEPVSHRVWRSIRVYANPGQSTAVMDKSRLMLDSGYDPQDNNDADVNSNNNDAASADNGNDNNNYNTPE